MFESEEYDIILLEKFPCSSKEELKARERYYIETLKSVNRNIPMRTNKEYYQDNKEKKAEYDKQYINDHRELIYKKHICDCGGKFTSKHRLGHLRTKRHLDHLESLKEVVENKIEPQIFDKLDEIYLAPLKLYVEKPCKMSDLYMCSCGAHCSLNSRDWHLKTRRHQESQNQADEVKEESEKPTR
jgi:hypothetical protein